MNHIDPEDLAALAMGERESDAADEAHLAECDACAAELDELTRTVELGRASRGTELVAPPAEVWSRIHSELGLSGDVSPGAAVLAAEPARESVAEAATGAVPETAPEVAPALAPVRSLPGPRRPRFWIPLAAAALVVGLIGGVGAGVWWESARQAEAGSTVAEANLEPFPEWPGARGSAVVEQRADGTRQVVVDVDSVVDSGSPDAPLREVWLIRTDGTGLISIGFLDGTSGRFDIPSGIDLVQYALVDVSAEADNGDPAHSGDSIVRGELRVI
ncbi:anti-sigma factor [Herbiconiux sp. CPCC 205763]|uniref:Anti-sigma factor n=1 Tax=Herbiconiux aconitum TaxID=2970913 RepID=A0ABT2GP88_9MICO|nr:anti-sigma factor [Herbiconiux aconitum]MCS5718042.1 anti-sigma factor [Herbiconiux aconitum]